MVVNPIPPIKTASNHQEKDEAFHESNQKITNRWAEQEERRRDIEKKRQKARKEARSEC